MMWRADYQPRERRNNGLVLDSQGLLPGLPPTIPVPGGVPHTKPPRAACKLASNHLGIRGMARQVDAPGLFPSGPSGMKTERTCDEPLPRPRPWLHPGRDRWQGYVDDVLLCDACPRSAGRLLDANKGTGIHDVD